MWQCKVRGEKLYCNATIKETNGIFNIKKDHVHPGKPGIYKAKEIQQKVSLNFT